MSLIREQPEQPVVTPQTPRLFISHSSVDKKWCARFVRHLNEAGADVWWDANDLRLGGFTTAIEREIENRPYFIVVWSPDARNSEWVGIEIEAAINLRNHGPEGRFVVPVMARKCDLTLFLGTFQGVIGPKDLQPKEAAMRLIRLLNLEPATPEMTRTSRSRPKSLDEAILQGQSLLSQGRPEEALNMFDTALKLDATSALAWFGKGRALHDLRRLDDAMTAYDHAIECDPGNPNGWAGRGQLNGEQGNFTAALSDLDQALELKPDYLSPLLNRSTVLRSLNRLEEALAATDAVIRLAPNYGPALLSRGHVLHDLNRNDEALAAYEMALRAVDVPDLPTTTPNDWRALTLSHKAGALQALHCPAAALDAYEQAIYRDPSCTPAWSGKGLTHWALGQYHEAFSAYEHALILATAKDELAAAWNGKGAALIGLGQPAEAKLAFLHALNIMPSWPNALSGLADALWRLNDGPGAKQAYEKALSTGALDTASTAETLSSLASLALSQGDAAAALYNIDRAIQTAPLNIRFWSNKVGILASLNRHLEAQSTQLELAQLLIAQSAATSSRNPNLSSESQDDAKG